VLVELRVGEQRLRAVWEVLDGASVAEVARRFMVSRQSVHSWLRRYAADEGLGDRSWRPHGCPHQMSPAVEARIVEIRRGHPGWGADRIGYQPTSWPATGLCRCRAGPVSIGRWCGTGWWCRASGSGGGRIIGGGNGPGRWSCGRWMWSAGSTSPMGLS
jgi:Helix-turn-helix domain